jgi:hypothetical protein
MSQSIALDRDALYYPYVHITDVNWLKATLLCFPNVRRMVPTSYMPEDSEEILEFCNTPGPRGEPLLTSVNLFSDAATSAEKSLLKKLKENDTFIRERYSRRATVDSTQKDDKRKIVRPSDLFLLHDEKIIYGLFNYLTSGNQDDCLAWQTEHPHERPVRHGRGQWLALHPALGSAILATKALAIAEEFGLDIVTDSSSVHHTIVSKKTEDIFNELIGKTDPVAPPADADTVDHLAEIVIGTNFDVSRLSVKQIATLLADGNDLRRFKNALAPIAASIPKIRDQDEREKRFREAAGEVNSEWEKYKKSLPVFALEALADTTELKWPEFASLALGRETALHLGIGAGISVALVSFAGLRIWRAYKKKASSPYSYLSKIASAQAKNQSFLVLPPP